MTNKTVSVCPLTCLYFCLYVLYQPSLFLVRLSSCTASYLSLGNMSVSLHLSVCLFLYICLLVFLLVYNCLSVCLSSFLSLYLLLFLLFSTRLFLFLHSSLSVCRPLNQTVCLHLSLWILVVLDVLSEADRWCLCRCHRGSFKTRCTGF